MSSAFAETDQRSRVLFALRSRHAIPVENPAKPGTPDVNYVEGWIELKWARAWPKRASTPLRLEHFVQEQRIWLAKRRRYQRHIYLLLQVRSEWFLFDGAVAAEHVGRDIATRAWLGANALKHWPKGLVDSELLAICTEGCESLERKETAK